MANDSNTADNSDAWSPPNFDQGGEPDDQPPGASAEGGQGSGNFIPVVADFSSEEIGFTTEEAPDETPDTGEPGGPDFASLKFQRENTLLTNAESYAESIREEAELYVTQMRKEVDDLNAQSEARYEEAREAREQAEQEAERLVSEAHEQVDGIRTQAHDEGMEEGRAEGMRKRYEEAGTYLKRFEAILLELAQFRRQVAYYAEKDSVRLAMLMAKKVVQQELKLNKELVWKILAKTLATLKGKGQFKVWLNPEDFRFAAKARPSLERFMEEEQTLSLRSNKEIPPGNVQIETDRELIDLTFQNQFRHLDAELNQALAERETAVINRPAKVTSRPAPEAQPQMEATPSPEAAASAEESRIENEAPEQTDQ